MRPQALLSILVLQFGCRGAVEPLTDTAEDEGVSVSVVDADADPVGPVRESGGMERDALDMVLASHLAGAIVPNDPGPGQSVWYADTDGDHFGDKAVTTSGGTTPPPGYVADDRDCDDTRAAVFPGSYATEIPHDGIDTDCDGKDYCTDLNCDNRGDILASSGGGGLASSNSYAFYSGVTYTASSPLVTKTAYVQDVADFNNDGYLDIVYGDYCFDTVVSEDGICANLVGPSPIYLGGASGHSGTNVTTFTTSGAYGLCHGDFDGDTYVDLVVANFEDGASVDIDSWVYYGSKDGFSSSDRVALPTHGASGCTAQDINGDARLDILFVDYMSDAGHETDSYVYWGQAAARFNAAARTALPTKGATNAEIADFDKDGQLDIVFSNYNDVGRQRDTNSAIYFGPDFSRRTDLPTSGANDVEVADLDKDGWTDVVFANVRDSAGSFDINSKVYFGSATGPSTARTASLPTIGAIDAELADINGDGWTDIVFSNQGNWDFANVNSYVYYNLGGAFTAAAVSNIPGHGARHVVTGDLDGDNKRDIVLAGSWDDANGFDTSSSVFFGADLQATPVRSVGADAFTVSIVGGIDGIRTADAW